MGTVQSDRNLLFGILALQVNFITRDALIKGMNAWVLEKDRSLGHILVEQGALRQDLHDALEVMVQKHLEVHGGAQKSLAVLSSVGSVRQELEKVADPDLHASLGHVSALEDRYPTRAPSVGAPSSSGTRFQVLRPHAKGGLGEVLVARDQELHREVALKQIQDRHADDPESRVRFLVEAEITGGLEHPGIVPVYGLGTYLDGRPFYAMRFIRGDSLAEAINAFHKAEGPDRAAGERALALRQLLRRFVDVCNAVAYAHSRGVLHRDLKPGNIMLGKYGETLVVDWGLAKVLDGSKSAPQSEEAPLELHAASSATPTMMGSTVGTPQFMSPEQAAGRLDKLGPASDVYCLGATLYCVLTGRAPFTDADRGTILQKAQRGDFPLPSKIKENTPRALEAVCRKAMALLPEDRFATPRDLADDIEHWLADEPVSAWPEPWRVRAGRWARRHQTGVASVGGLLAASVVGLALGLWAVSLVQAETEKQRDQANTNWEQAEVNRKRAEANEKRADDARKEVAKKAEALSKEQKETRKQLERAEWLLYDSHIQAAQREWEAGNGALAWEHLEACRWDYRGPEHRYLCNLFNHNHVTLKGHTAGVRRVAFSPDGRRIVSASWDQTVKVWDARTGKDLRTTRVPLTGAQDVAFDLDGGRIASANADNTVKVWDCRTGKALLTLKGHTNPVLSVAFSPDGSRIVSGGVPEVKVWDGATGKALLTLRGHVSFVVGVAFSPDGKRIVTGSHDKTVRVWDAHTGKALRSLTGHTEWVNSVAFSPDGGRIISGSVDRTVKVWDAQSGKELLTLRGHTRPVFNVAVSADGGRIVSGSDDDTVRMWDARTGKQRLVLKGHTGGVGSVAFSPDGARILTGSSDRTVRVWAARSDQGLSDERVAYSPDGGRIARPRGNEVEVRDAHTGQHLVTFKGHTEWVSSVAFSRDGSRIVSSPYDNTAKVWDARTGKELLSLTAPGDHAISSLAFSAEDSHIISRTFDGAAQVWSSRTGKHLLSLQGGPSLAVSKDGSRIAGSKDKSVKVWDARTGKELFSLEGHTLPVTSVAISPDGSRIVTGSHDKTVRAWDARTGKNVLTLKGHTHSVTSVQFSFKGDRIASGSYDATVKVWDARTGTGLLSLRGHTNWVNSVAFSPDDSRIVSSSNDNSAKLWDARTGKELVSLRGRPAGPQSIEFSPDGNRVISSNSDGWPVNVWDARPGKDLLTLRGHPDTVTRLRFIGYGLIEHTEGDTNAVRSVAVSPDGKRVFGQDEKGKALAWDADTGQFLPEAPPRLPARREAASADGKLRARIEDGVIQVSRPGLEKAIRLREAEDRAWLERLARFDPAWHRAQLDDALRAGDDNSCAFHLERLLRGEPWDAALHVHYAHVLARLGKREESAMHLTRALFLSPRVSLWPVDPAAARRGEQAAQAGDWPRAVEALQVASHQPQAPSNTVLRDLLLVQAITSDLSGAQKTTTVLAGRLAREKNLRVVDSLFYWALVGPWEKSASASLLAHARQRADKQRDASTLDFLGAALYRASQYDEAARALAESVKAQGKGGYADSWLFQAMVARQRGEHDEALRMLARFEQWHRKKQFSSWQDRVRWDILLAEARKLINTPPPMPKVAPGE